MDHESMIRIKITRIVEPGCMAQQHTGRDQLGTWVVGDVPPGRVVRFTIRSCDGKLLESNPNLPGCRETGKFPRAKINWAITSFPGLAQQIASYKPVL